MAMPHNRAVAVQNPDLHGAGMQIEAAVQLMLLGVKSPEVAPEPVVLAQCQQSPRYAEGFQ
jgi:hypothetical protein